MLLYIHIPFCESKCPYCAFGSVIGQLDLAKDYISALILDFKFWKEKLNLQKNTFESIFIGGGTPNTINSKIMEPLFKEIMDFAKKDAEITSEANPNLADLDWLKNLRQFGLNRISFGAQSFFEDKLKFLGRNHDKQGIYKAIELSRIANIDNINIDIIYATKFDNKNRLQTEIENLKNLNLSHISAYSLTLEENTPFYGKLHYQKDSEKLSKFFIDQIEKIGLKQYEISNFGKICKHNLGYWQKKDYLGIGAFSVGQIKNQRLYANKNLKKYLQNPALREIEILSENDNKLESIFLGARSIVGIDIEILNKKKVEILIQEGKCYKENNRLFNKNFLIADEIALFLNS